MISLDEAKEMMRDVISHHLTAQGYTRMDTTEVYREGWEPLGEDYYINMVSNQVAGPDEGGPTRVVADLSTMIPRQHEEAGTVPKEETGYDISQDWDRQVGEELIPERAAVQTTGQPESDSSGGQGKHLSKDRCTCDT